MLFEKKPSSSALSALGLENEDFPPQICLLWPENIRPFNLFNCLNTQWRVAMGGVVGLDYNVLLHELDRMGLDKKDYDDIFESIRVMEIEAMAQMRNK